MLVDVAIRDMEPPQFSSFTVFTVGVVIKRFMHFLASEHTETLSRVISSPIFFFIDFLIETSIFLSFISSFY